MKTKEAIERVRSRFDKWALDNEDLAALQTLGLVDVESEDERIRKQCIKLLREAYSTKYEAFECIAYLEKQKHSLNFDAISSWLKDHVSRYINSEYNEFHHCFEYDGTIDVEKLIADLEVAVDSGIFDVHEQKEQKPIFKKGDKVIWDGEEFNILDVDKDTYNVGGYIVPFSREGELHPIGQKPAEWDEEDEQNLSVCLSYIKDETLRQWLKDAVHAGYNKPVECIEFDNEFKNQVSHLLVSVLNKEWEYNKAFVEYAAQQLLGYAKHEIKPAEWSEEDKEAYDMCYDAIPKAWKTKSGKLLTEWLKDKLKSLPERFNLQPKQEWSEDDEHCIELLDTIIDSSALIPKNRIKCHAFLKSLLS